jgi:hypothetical protein
MGYIEFLLSSACPPDVGMPLLFFFLSYAHIKLWMNLPWFCGMI